MFYIRIIKFSILLLSYLGAPNILFSQYLFSNLGYEDGMSSKQIECMLEDSDGFIWFGTANGLNRFDGSRIKVYNHANQNYPSDLNEYIFQILEYDRGSFLLGTSNGLVCFDYYNHQFSQVSTANANLKPGHIFSVRHLIKDSDDRVWIGTNQGWFVFISGQIMNAYSLFPELQNLDTLVLSGAVFDNNRNGIWISTNDGLRFFNVKTGKVWSHKDFPDTIPVFTNDPAYGITVDNQTGNIYWSDAPSLLNFYDRAKKKSQKIVFNEFLEKIYTGKYLYLDKHHRLWLSTWHGITFVVEPDNNLLQFPEASMDPYPINNGFVLDILETFNGDLWLGTAGGAFKLSSSAPITRIFDITDDKSHINYFIRTRDKIWWLANETGLYYYNENTGETKRHLVDPETINANRFFHVVEIDDELWCGTRKGIQIFKPKEGFFYSPKYSDYTEEINSQAVTEIIRDQKGYIWFSVWISYVYRYNPSTNECIRYDGKDPGHGDIGRTNSLVIEEARDGRIWVGYHDKGIRIFDHQKNTFFNPVRDSLLNFSIVNGMAEDKNHEMWLSTKGNGIYRLNYNGEIVSHLTTEHGLSSNMTNSITLDPNGMLWFATPEAIHYLKPGSGKVETVRLDIAGSMSEYWIQMQFDENNNYASVFNQIFQIDINRIQHKSKLSPPLITDVSVFEKHFPYSPLVSGIELSYKENFFRIEYSSTQHNENPSLQYEYQMSGFDGDWVRTDRDLIASYTNVPPGQYTFMVRAVDENGNLKSDPTLIPFVIQPPFWKTTWFYIFITAFVLFILYQVYLFQERRKEKRKGDQIIDYFANSVYGENAVNEICWDIARNCISQLGFKECAVYLADHEKKILVEKASFGPRNPKGTELVQPREISIGTGIVGQVALTGEPLLKTDLSKDVQSYSDNGMSHSILAVPIMHDQQVIGVIEAEDSRKHFFTEDHVKTLTMIASISALKIADAKAEIVRKENELRLLEVNKLFTESQLQALRAQMNPHFVFNCLNSIQECIVTKKFAEASAYLNKFARLFRLVLNNSGKMLISIEEEVEILRLYLELESMRFDHSFQYSIEIDPELEADDILVPSMFLQPFVENALWHGLMHKPDDRQLKITFQKLSEETFACIVEDNGIGRQRSGELKKANRVQNKYESRGMKITEERLEVLRRQNYHASLSIEDKNGSYGIESGTKVIVELSTSLSNI